MVYPRRRLERSPHLGHVRAGESVYVGAQYIAKFVISRALSVLTTSANILEWLSLGKKLPLLNCGSQYFPIPGTASQIYWTVDEGTPPGSFWHGHQGDIVWYTSSHQGGARTHLPAVEP